MTMLHCLQTWDISQYSHASLKWWQQSLKLCKSVTLGYRVSIAKDTKNSLSCFGGDRTGSSLQASQKDWCLELQYHQEGVEDIPLLSCWRKIWGQDSNKLNQVLYSCSLWWNIMKQMGKKLQCNNLPPLQDDSINLNMPDCNLWNEGLVNMP